MSRLHAFGKLSKGERENYIENMNFGISNHKTKRKIDKLSKQKVRDEDNMATAIKNKLGIE
jgi:predicted secreted protein